MSPGKILIVDDDPQIRRVLKVILSGGRYELSEARSGESALCSCGRCFQILYSWT